jgi:ammonia channel protein AmtB
VHTIGGTISLDGAIALGPRLGRVSFNTTMAACSAGLTSLFYSYFKGQKWDLALTVNGFLAGLVAITCPATGLLLTALS